MESGLAIVVLLGLVMLRWVLLGIGAALILRPVTHCPACCRNGTHRLHRPWLERIAPWLEWRWCLACGWSGPARHVPEPAAPSSDPSPQPSVR